MVSTKKEYKLVILEKKGNIATITFNRPEKLNALNPQMRQDFTDALVEVDNDPTIKCLIVTGKGRGFFAGVDYREGFKAGIEERKREGIDPTRGWGIAPRRSVQLEQMKVPVIAAVNGISVGAGCTFLCHADIVIASEEATFSFRFSKIGLILEWGSTYYLPRMIGIRKAAELAYTARWFDAKEALEIGWVNKVVPHAQLMKASLDMAKEICENSVICNRFNKRGLWYGQGASLEQAQMFESFGLSHVSNLPYFEETVDAFLEKRPPKR
ncbi:MAG: enoyl-CoA hydratase/isomerase family protein [Dehalococcoidia bacterium]|nr:enoyl-CoA hydratase/isomerase family protein [Dehalococcoidia bacterium]